MKSNINIDSLPIEMFCAIIDKVEVANWNKQKQISFPSCLEPCGSCQFKKINCMHLHPDEECGLKNLILVCKKWKYIIRQKYCIKFKPFVPECLNQTALTGPFPTYI